MALPGRRLLCPLILAALAALSLRADDTVRRQQHGDATGEVLPSTEFACHSLSRDNYTCSACIQQHDTCAWCESQEFDSVRPHSRCDSIANLIANNCSNIVNYLTELRAVQDEALSEPHHVDEEVTEAVQVKPQEMAVTIRPKSRVRFNITYRQAVDYPVDLYYLMDLSFSMKDDKENLAVLGDKIADRMMQISKNFRIGFGSFIDKKIMPFIDPRTLDEKNPASPCHREFCPQPWGYRHEMTLSTNTKSFRSSVKKSQISGNLDAPEGGFDAIVQSLVCNNTGWRDRTRRMLVFSTDAGFHFAGDARLAGIIEPNDGECHLDQEGFYTESIKQDYPSVALLHKIIKEKKANVIFAVTDKQQTVYQQLANALPDISSSVGVLKNDSSNIVELIAREYEKIAEKIIMVDNANASEGFLLSYRSRCLDGTVLEDTNVCDNIKVGDDVTFEVTMEITHCVAKRDFLLRIGPSGLDDALNVHVHVKCDCDCEENVEKYSPVCNGGDLVCGVCRCPPGKIGKYCECDSNELSTAALDQMCKMTNDSAICEGRGECKCGKCVCFKRNRPEEIVSGQFCECDNFSCPRFDRKMCSEQGECVCGKCLCKPGWTGIDCHCPISNDACMINGKICNGHGTCECGQCKCDEDHSGPHCEICHTCAEPCVQYRPCVQCQAWKTGSLNETACEECPFTITLVDELPTEAEFNNRSMKHCQFVDTADDCTFYFKFFTDEEMDHKATVFVRKHKDCPPPVPILAIVLGVIAGIVILGILLLLLWKLLTVLHDRAEYAKFNNERLMAKWDTNENPIYKQATTTFKNPVYAGKQK